VVAAQPLQSQVVLVVAKVGARALARNRSQFVPGMTPGSSTRAPSPTSSAKSEYTMARLVFSTNRTSARIRRRASSSIGRVTSIHAAKSFTSSKRPIRRSTSNQKPALTKRFRWSEPVFGRADSVLVQDIGDRCLKT